MDRVNGEGEVENSRIGDHEAVGNKMIIKHLFLRIFLFLLSLTALVVMVTSKQTKLVMTPYVSHPVSLTARYSDFDALVYFAVAVSVALAYGLITSLATFLAMRKRCSSKSLIKFYLVLMAHDAVMIGIVAAATGAGGCVGYLSLKGNSKLGWNKVCNIYSKNCKQILVSIIMSLGICLLLVLLVSLSALSVQRLARKALN